MNTPTRQAAPEAPDELDHAETVLRVQEALGITRTGWVSPDVIVMRIEQLQRKAAPEEPTAATDQPSAGQVDERMLLRDWEWALEKKGVHVSRGESSAFLEGVRKARASLTPTAPQAATTASAQAQQDAVNFGISITRTHADGTIERIDPLSIYKEPEDGPVQAVQPALPAEPIGIVGTMPGTDGFTMACFKASEVPVGTKLYLAAPGAAQTTDAREGGAK